MYGITKIYVPGSYSECLAVSCEFCDLEIFKHFGANCEYKEEVINIGYKYTPDSEKECDLVDCSECIYGNYRRLCFRRNK